ncbi:Arc family DNA-binding protein [Vibrio alginolyticus]
MSKPPPFPLRIPAETRQYLEDQALANDRSLQKELLSRIDLTIWLDTAFQDWKIGYSSAPEQISNVLKENTELQALRAENTLLQHDLNQHKALSAKLIERFEKGEQNKELDEAYRHALELKALLEKLLVVPPSGH